ncbi:hypothetical protein DEO72_LG5g2159 [Vigna unguiculata]|uniref:Secreted protein n=1 Tax=Vigna unguiculata TaxID=3917 RepID=A0A4D6M0K8_VIGUN|nr:hypothetical protein DEO72_LG5g2159 [Vigna unguiculata]
MAAALTFLLLQVHRLGCVVSRFPASCKSAVAGVMCGEDLVRCRYSVVAPGGFAPAAFFGVAACALQRWFAVTVDLFWLTGAAVRCRCSRWSEELAIAAGEGGGRTAAECCCGAVMVRAFRRGGSRWWSVTWLTAWRWRLGFGRLKVMTWQHVIG